MFRIVWIKRLSYSLEGLKRLTYTWIFLVLKLSKNVLESVEILILPDHENDHTIQYLGVR